MLNYITKYIITLRYIKLISHISTKWLHKRIPVIPNIDSKDLIKILPEKILKYLQNMHQLSKQKPYKLKYIYYYGFQIIYGAINKFTLLILLGLLFNILSQLLIITISFVSLRVWAGGLHFDSYTKCAYVSLISFVIMGLLAKYIYLNITIIVTIFLTVFVLFFIYGPVEHSNRPLKNNEKIKFKIGCSSFYINYEYKTISMHILSSKSLRGWCAMKFKRILKRKVYPTWVSTTRV